MRKQKTNTSIRLSSGTYPVQVIGEHRRGVRAAVGTKSIILRFPIYFTAQKKAETWSWFMSWIRDLDLKKENVLAHLRVRSYQTGQTLQVGSRIYVLKIEEVNRKSGAGKLIDNELCLKLPLGLDPNSRSEMIKGLCSRLVAKDFHPTIEARVQELNQRFFRKPIENIRLKYNASNWGSCSSKKNINLSTRLLFAPDEVIDYVIIHELAHLIQPNHSPKFWALVEKVMPGYKQHEDWLTQNGPDCDF